MSKNDPSLNSCNTLLCVVVSCTVLKPMADEGHRMLNSPHTYSTSGISFSWRWLHMKTNLMQNIFFFRPLWILITASVHDNGALWRERAFKSFTQYLQISFIFSQLVFSLLIPAANKAVQMHLPEVLKVENSLFAFLTYVLSVALIYVPLWHCR